MPRATETPAATPVRGDAANVVDQQLPQGGAATVEAGLQQAKNLAQQTASSEAPPVAPQEARGAAFTPPDGVVLDRGRGSKTAFDNPDDQFLYGPTGRPAEPLAAGTRLGHRAPPPSDVMNWLPTLVHAANQPDAPQELRDLLREIVYSLGG